MHWAECRASICKSLKRPFAKTAVRTSYHIAIILTGLTFLALCGLAEPACAQHPELGLADTHAAGVPHPGVDDSDFIALREYAQSIGVEDSAAGTSVESENPHTAAVADSSAPDAHARFAAAHAKIDLNAHLSHPEFAALRAYASEIAGDQSRPAAPA